MEKGGTVDGRADVFAAGVILHEMLTGEIIGAPGYKKIGELYEDYAFLDDVVEMLYKQNPDDRLFPARRIIEDLYARIEISKSEKETVEMEQLLIDVQQSSDDFMSFENPQIIGIQTEDAQIIVFKLVVCNI